MRSEKLEPSDESCAKYRLAFISAECPSAEAARPALETRGARPCCVRCSLRRQRVASLKAETSPPARTFALGQVAAEETEGATSAATATSPSESLSNVFFPGMH